jgi:diguanylate cyclase (GGDEF)-like protein
LKWWSRAWTANFLALLVTTLFWLLRQPDRWYPLVTMAYVSGKTAFALMLAQGAWLLVRPGSRLFTNRQLAVGLIVYAVISGLLLREVEVVGIVQHSVMGFVLIALAVRLSLMHTDGITWLIGGIAARGMFALGEAASYAIQYRMPESALAAQVGAFVAASSSFDMGAEWLIVLGSVLAVSERGRRALEESHYRLVVAQDDLRRLADRDPLTGATNRRALRDIFKDLQGKSATLLFFDLDGFKQINDVHGHAAGDECLRLFANALKESFRPDDHVVRYGGDEFLVIARGLDSTAARSRVEDVTRRIHADRSTVTCGFSVGMSELPPDGAPEAALQQADTNMYKAKNRDRR